MQTERKSLVAITLPPPLLFAHIGGSIYQLERCQTAAVGWVVSKVESWDENDQPILALGGYYVIENADGTLDCDCPDSRFRLEPADLAAGTHTLCKHRQALLTLGLVACPALDLDPAIPF